MLHINVLHKSTYVFSPPWSHCFARELFRTAIARCLLAALLAMPILASSLARCSLIIAHSCFVSRSLMSLSRFFCFSILTAWGAWSARDTEQHRVCEGYCCFCSPHLAAQVAASSPSAFAETVMISSSLILWPSCSSAALRRTMPFVSSSAASFVETDLSC